MPTYYKVGKVLYKKGYESKYALTKKGKRNRKPSFKRKKTDIRCFIAKLGMKDIAALSLRLGTPILRDFRVFNY